MRHVFCTLALLLASCGSAKTEILVTLDSELTIPSEIDTFELDVRLESGARRSFRRQLIGTNATALPYVFGIENALGETEAVQITVTGTTLDAKRIERRVRTELASDRRVELAITLERSCLDVLDCGDGLTCREGACTSDVARDGELVVLGAE